MPARSAPILVVEVHPDVRVALQMALEYVGYDVRLAADAAQARAELTRMGRPGLLMLDEALPDAERLGLLRLVREEPTLRALPVVMLSLDEQPRSPDVQAVLRKPFTLDRLYAVVKTHCEVRDVPRVRTGAPLFLVPRPASATASNG